jgi:hypothetical protein
MPALPDNPPAVPAGLPPTAASAKLDYANVPRAHRWRRRIGRWTILVTLIASVGLGIKYRPLALRHRELLKLQRQCLDAELPQALPTVELDTNAAQRLLQAHPADYYTMFGGVTRRDSRWEQLRLALGLAPPASRPGVLFLHQRYTPSGQRRLVVLEGDIQSLWGKFLVKVIHPAGPFWGATVTSSQVEMEQDVDLPRIEMIDPGYDARVGAGIADLTDHSRFTVPMIVKGETTILEFRLLDDDTVTMRVRPPQAAPPSPRPPPVDPLELPARQEQQSK